MTELSQNWVTEGLIDFEYKKYMLLAYLKHVRDNFDGKKLYPFLSDLIFHLRTLQTFQENKNMMYRQFPKSLTVADLTARKLTFQRVVEESELMTELQSIMEFALLKFGESVTLGKEIYDYIADQLDFEPVGISPMYTQEGYFFLHQKESRDVGVYRYQISMFEDSGHRYRSVSTRYLFTSGISLTNTYENIKIEVIRKNNELPNPATYLVYSKIQIPTEETLLPIAKRILVRKSVSE